MYLPGHRMNGPPAAFRPGLVRPLASLGASPERVADEVIGVLERPSPPPRRDNVVTCRVDDRTLDTLEARVESGVYTTRSEAAVRLIAAGIDANAALLEEVHAAVAEIRRLREQPQGLLHDWKATASAGKASGR
jgi:Arc/MetJ-type ribon-helix-helix transcriptional regulator